MADADAPARPGPAVSLRPVAALLASITVLVLGNGLLGTLLAMRAGLEGFPEWTIGTMMSAYFAGYLVGSILVPRVIARAGHVRVFAAFASIASAAALAHLIVFEWPVWIVLRGASGLCYAAMILVTESWLNAHALPMTRGRLLAVYGIATMGAWAVSQLLLNLAPVGGIFLFLLVSILISLSLVPLTLARTAAPEVAEGAALGLSDLWARSPLGVLGSLLAGLAMSAFWGMGPRYAQGIGLDDAGVSVFMAATIAGGLALQWPLGWVSDRTARRNVVVAGAGAAMAAGFALSGLGDAALPAVTALGFVFGGFGIPLYALCVAHANDRLGQGQFVAAARALMILNGAGSALGPFAAGLSAEIAGPRAIFAYAAVVLTALAILGAARMPLRRAPEREAAPRIAGEHIPLALDPRAKRPRSSRSSRVPPRSE